MLRSRRILLLALIPFFGLVDAQAAEAPKLKVLFLGDRGHHRPSELASILRPVMDNRGIELTYTEDVEKALRLDRLREFDALLVYANIDTISPESEKALLAYVEGGGGFVPIHCASFCFRNSDAVVGLIGAQFQRHGMEEFDTKIVDAAHPIMKGLVPFRTRDETYVHTKHNPKDRVVLQTRPEGAGEEPWTWIRTHGKGRVFYTAYGHDERTWTDYGFHDLLERGIRWASAKGEVVDHHPRAKTGLEPFAYTPAKVPFYTPGQRWGTQSEPIREMQKPISPERSQKHLILPDGFAAELFVAEPQIGKPLCMAWDHKGRLWIAETVDYPNDLQPPGKGNDRISIIEDRDGDGRADHFTVFADKLSIPTSIAFARGGLLVHSAPHTLFLKDTNGDDKADVREIVLEGWGTNDTHAGPSNMRYGLDNWIYGMVGYSGFNGRVGGETARFGQGFHRFRPDGSKLEFLRSTNNNSWGVGFSEEGFLFGSTANGCPSVYLPIPNRYYEAVRGWSGGVLQNIADSYRFFTETPKVRQVDWHGGFTAGAGHAIYTARTYPSRYWNSTAFITEPTGHIVATFTLHPHGSDFVSHNAWNLVASDDEWTSPIVAEVGPDGNVWMIDWYSFIIQHNPTPQGFENGKGNAYVTPLRDKVHGRIYRIVSKDGRPSANPGLDPSDAKSLLTGLRSDNQLWRMHAQRLLVERGKVDVVPDLIALVSDRSVDAVGLNAPAIHALWTLHGLGRLSGQPDSAEAVAAVRKALEHPSAGVRRNASLVLPRDGRSLEAIRSAKLLSDPDAQVRLAALLTLSELPASAEIGALVAQALLAGAVDGDRWLPDALTAAAATHDAGFLAALAASRVEKPSAETLAVAARIAEHHARGGPADTIGGLLAGLESTSPVLAEAIIAGLDRGWPASRKARVDDAFDRALAALMLRVGPEAKGRLVGLAERWGSKGLEKFGEEIAQALLASVKDEKRSERERSAAARQFVEFRKAGIEPVETILEMINARTSPTLAAALLEAIARSEAPEAGARIVQAIPDLTPQPRQAALRALIAKPEWTRALLDGFEKGTLPVGSLALDQTQALASHRDRSIQGRFRRLVGQGGGLPDADRQKVIDEVGPLVAKGGDPALGKQVFTKECAKCHRHGEEGGKVGPDLTGMAAHPREELLIHILDPSRSVEGNFTQYTAATADGRVLNGLLASENRTSVELLDAEGKTHTLLREDLEEFKASKKSLMPEGFEKQVPVDSIRDLLAFLTNKGKYLPLDLRKAATVVTTKGMFYEEEGDLERLIFPDWSPKMFEGVPFALVDPNGGRTPNAVMLQSPNGKLPPTMPKAVNVACNTPARAIHLLSGVSGWGWPASRAGTVSMIVRLHYADGETEDHSLRNGVHFADYIRVVDVPESKLAFKLRGQQIRFLTIRPKRASSPIERIELLKGPDISAPVVMAMTVEVGE
ncbi:MAG: ThuA domain-containing protein [Isosphaeraceae bacterium]|nr:ThuA domain-containing protein [Isosphaeraceae bacterium]